MSKKRILFINEFSGLKTGFSIIGNEIIGRLFNTGKYEIAEYASYVDPYDHRLFEFPWKIYCSMPAQNDPRLQHYHSDPTAQFGSLMFEEVLLDFKPDICIDIRDFWMIEFQERSPFRDKFKWIIMPTIDSAPQQASWLDVYSNADKVIGYCRYAKEVLEEESGGRIKVDLIARAGVNPSIYKALDKKQCRKELGLPENANIILKVSRNQSRKLFPNLIDAFKTYLERYGDKNTYLYLHTSFPDVGFALDKIILKSGISHRILTTYKCQVCHYCWADFFQTELTPCKRCKNLSASMTNTNNGVTSEDLAKIYNASDLYVQYSMAEGLSVPMVEAKACGIPTMGVDYSAMSEQLEVEGTWKIAVKQRFHESVMQTEQIRVYPDDDDLVRKIHKFFKSSPQQRKIWSESVKKDAVENYSYERAASIFEKAIDETVTPDQRETWLSPQTNIKKINNNPPEIASNSDFVDWCIDNVVHDPSKKNSYWKSCIVKDLGVGYQSEKGQRRPFDRKACFEAMAAKRNHKNMWEQERIRRMTPIDDDVFSWRMV